MIGSGMTLDVDNVASASPLQRLKALTHSDVVNHAAAPPSTRTPAVVRSGVPLSLPAAMSIGVARQPPNGLFYNGPGLVERRQTSPAQCVLPRSMISTVSVSASTVVTTVAGSVHMSIPRTDCRNRRRSSPAVRASASPAIARHRVCWELGDHGYSTPVPPAVVHRPCLPQSASIPCLLYTSPSPRD